MRAKDIMTRPVHVVAPDAPVESAADPVGGHQLWKATVSGEFDTDTERAVADVGSLSPL
jgi:CBS domain-containing protein